MKKILLAIAALLCFPALQAQDVAFGDDEKLTFRVSYRAALFPDTEVATVWLNINKNVKGNYDIYARGKTTKVGRWFFSLDDVYQTTLSGTTLRPLVSTWELREGNYRFSGRIDFDWKNMVANTMWRNHKHKNPNYRNLSMPNSQTSDALGIFYNLRNKLSDQFVVDQSQSIFLVLEDTIRQINFRFLGKEDISLKGLGKFRTLKFSCDLATSDGERFEDGSVFFLWISDDKNKIPLKLNSPIKVGSVSVRLTNFSGLRYPVESKIE